MGDPLPELAHEVTQESVDRFAAASLDVNPVHVDPDWCARARVFDTEPVLHGMASMALMTSVVLRAWGAAAEIRSIDSTFTKPTPVGRSLSVSGVVTEAHHIAPGRNFVVVAVRAVDDEGDTVGTSRIAVRLRD